MTETETRCRDFFAAPWHLLQPRSLARIHPMVKPSSPPPSSPQSRDAIRALVGEYMDQKKRETHENALVNAPKRVRASLVIVALLTCAIVWILPSLVKTPVEAPSPERAEASARMTLFLASERVRAYRRATTRLPRNLTEAGVDSTSLTYFKSSDSTFEIWTAANGERVTYKSSMSTPAFLGTTLQTLSTSR